MGNEFSSPDDDEAMSSSSKNNKDNKSSSGYTEFLSSAGKTIGEASGIVCGTLNDTFDKDLDENDILPSSSSRNNILRPNSRNRNNNNAIHNVIASTDIHTSNPLADDLLCGNMNNTLSPKTGNASVIFANPDDNESLQTNPMSALFARALLNEVSDPSTMKPNDMAAREKKLLKAQTKARTASKNNLRAVGGQGTMKGQMHTFSQTAQSRIMPPNLLSENRAQVVANGGSDDYVPNGKYRVTIGLMLSRRDSRLGHADTVTRQTAFDFNELQDRKYKYVSSTDSYGWRAGGGESGKLNMNEQKEKNVSTSMSDDTDGDLDSSEGNQQSQSSSQHPPKVASQDTVHIPIIHIDCDSPAAVDSVIAALARGEVFIPHMSILPEALGVNGISPPDLVVRFGCERNDDMPPEEWPNWCLEFMHNQLYDYFSDMGARWMRRPFQITLAKKVRWKTVKHMNKFFSHSEHVINSWREKGPQQLDPQPSYVEGGASPEEVARPHGIYLLRNGKPTNYFAPNFDPPYTTKMTRSLLLNVMGKSWDRKRRDWSSEPLARVTTNLLLSSMCGCAEPNDGGYLAREATTAISPYSVKTRTPSFFAGENTNVSPNNKAEYSPFRKKTKKKIEPDLTQKAHDQHQKLYEGLKVKREASGIRRSQLEGKSKNMDVKKSDTMETETSFSPGDNEGNPFNSNEPQSDDNYGDETEPHQQENENITTDYDWIHTPEKRFNGVTNLDQESFDMAKESVNNFFSSSTNETPLMNNQERRKKQKNKLNFNGMPMEAAIPEEKATNENANKNHDTASQSQGSTHQDAGMSIGESQTTVPTFNGSSAKFIEQERERRKERELQREKEREKIDKLERAIEEKMRINQEKQASTPQRNKSSKDKGTSEKKSSKKDKKAKKEKKKREKKERREREKSRDSKTSQKTEENSDNNVDWKMESPQQSVKENFPLKNESQSVKQSKVHSSPKKSVEWSNDSSYLPINLNGNSVNNSPISSRYSQSNVSSSKNSSSSGAADEVSLDYSMDTASLLGDGSLIGGQFAGDSSVFTAATSASDNKSLLSYVTRSTVHDVPGRNRPAAKDSRTNADENDDISLTLVASTSSGMELIPTDEDLFAIGWAKAMDPNSGSYYYYTLDRSKTVWDNPLNNET